MFSFGNLYTKSNTTIDVVLGDNQKLSFVVGTVIGKRTDREQEDPMQFELLNKYLDWKGDAFKQELFNKLQRSFWDTENLITNSDLYPLPYYIVTDIAAMFPLADVEAFIRDVYRIKVPENFPEFFDEQIEKDGRGTRIQTYTISDYISLAAFITVTKVIAGPLCHYAFAKQNIITPTHIEYVLYSLLAETELYDAEANNKLLGWVDILIKQMKGQDETIDNILVIETNFPTEELPKLLVARLMFHRLTLAVIINDNSQTNIVTKIFNFFATKIKPGVQGDKSIRDKKPMKNEDSGSGDPESIVESYRIVSEIDPGAGIEMDWAISTQAKVLFQLPEKYKEVLRGLPNLDEMLDDSYGFCQQFREKKIQPVQITLLSIIFKSIIDPRALDYVKIDSIITLFSVAFPFLWALDLKQLAVLLTSTTDRIDTNEDIQDSFVVNITTNKTRIDSSLKEDLAFYFPYERRLNDRETQNIAEVAIADMDKELRSFNWIPLASQKYLDEVFKEGNGGNIIPPDLKVQLGKLLIQNERLIMEGARK